MKPSEQFNPHVSDGRVQKAVLLLREKGGFSRPPITNIVGSKQDI